MGFRAGCECHVMVHFAGRANCGEPLARLSEDNVTYEQGANTD